jgi:hypothetical protein
MGNQTKTEATADWFRRGCRTRLWQREWSITAKHILADVKEICKHTK